MTTFSIIQKSQLEGANRIDAEYYQPEYLFVKRLLVSKPYTILGRHAFVTDGEHGSVDFLNDGIKYLVAENVQEGFLNLEGIRFVSEDVNKRNRRASLEPLDIVLSIKGTIGQSAIVFKENLPANMNRDVSRIHVRDIIDPFFLAVFLNSKFGLGQTLRESSGNVQQMITLGRIRELIVPKVAKSIIEKIKDIYLRSYKELQNSILFYSQAENLLLEELGLKDFEFGEDLAYVIGLSDVEIANRADSQFFQPKYNRILKKLATKKLVRLDDCFDSIKSKNFPYFEDGEIGLIQTKQLKKRFINFEIENKVKKEVTVREKLPFLQDKDVIFASMGVGSLGKTNMFYGFETDEDYTIDSTLRIFRHKQNTVFLPEVLAVYLSSPIGQELIYKYIVGTSGIISIYEKYLQEFPLPVLKKSLQEKIAELVRKSHEARKKAKELLEEAKRKVEEMIEKGEKNG